MESKVLGYEFVLNSGSTKSQLRSLIQMFGLAGGGVGLTAAIKAATDEAATFETGLARVSTLLPANESAIERYGASVTDLSIRFGESTAVISDALFQVISAGVDSTDAITMMDEVVGKLAKGGFTDMRTAADGLTNTMNAWGLTSRESAKDIADAFFVANLYGKTTIEELSRTVGNVAPTAEKAGLSFEELFSAIAAGTKVGLKTSTTVDSLRTALSSTFRPTQEAAEVAAELGLQFDENAIRAQGLAGFLENVAAKTGGSAEKLSTLFGSVEAANVIMTLTSEQGLASFNEALTDMGSNASQTDLAFSKASATFEAKVKRIQQSVSSLWRAAGEEVIDGFGGDLDTIGKKFVALEDTIRTVMSTVVNSVKWAADNIEEIVAVFALGAANKGLESLAERFENVAAVAEELGDAAGSIGGKAEKAAKAARFLGNVTLYGQAVIISAEVGAMIGSAIANQVHEVDLARARGGAADARMTRRLQASGLIHGSLFGSGPDAGDLGLLLARAGSLRNPDLVKGDGLEGMLPTERREALAVASQISGMAIDSAERFQALQDALVAELKANPVRQSGGVMVGQYRRAGFGTDLFGPAVGGMIDQWADVVSPGMKTREGGSYAPGIQRALERAAERVQSDETERRRQQGRVRDIMTRDGLFAGLGEAARYSFAGSIPDDEGQDGRYFGDEATQILSDGMLDAFDAVVDKFGPVVESMQAAADSPVSVMVELFHKIFDSKKPPRAHRMSLQKRGAAKGPSPRYHALVLRHGYGAAIVEPLPDNLVDVGMNRGAM